MRYPLRIEFYLYDTRDLLSLIYIQQRNTLLIPEYYRFNFKRNTFNALYISTTRFLMQSLN